MTVKLIRLKLWETVIRTNASAERITRVNAEKIFYSAHPNKRAADNTIG